MSAALRNHLRTLADARANQLAIDEEVRRVRAEFDAANHALLANQRDGKGLIEALERDARALALALYAVTGEKSVAPGVEIKVGKEYVYGPADALAWARETKMCLLPESLDEKAFKKIAAATPLPFVTIREEPKAFLATQLNAAEYAEAIIL
jgi:hypothetical protein